MDVIKINIKFKDFVDFLIDAKKKTYAGSGQKMKLDDYSNHYNYEKNPFRYHDIYYGSLIDGGRELVYFKDKPIWFMGYHGGIYGKNEFLAQEIFDFLKEALLQIPEEFPARGPKIYSKNNFTYLNNYTGDIRRFFGEEVIKINNNHAYLRNYVGGFISDRQYRISLIGGKNYKDAE